MTVAFFTLFGFIFLMTQYFQFIKGYGPLSAGVHLLPVATSVGRRLGARHEARGALRDQADRRRRPGAGGRLLPLGRDRLGRPPTTARSRCRWSLYGVGMGFTSAPATEAIMGVVPRAKAGVGSAVNDATRLLGGTLGVAVIGSVYASVYASRLAAELPAQVPHRVGGSGRSLDRRSAP